MHFYDFCKKFHQGANGICVNGYGWKDINCPFQFNAVNEGWHQDNECGGVRLLFKLNGIVAHGLMKGNF